MTLALIVIIICAVVGIIGSVGAKNKSRTYQNENRASFIAEAEEYARWGEEIFKEYCGLVGTEFAKNEIITNEGANGKIYAMEYYMDESGFEMPRIPADSRVLLGYWFCRVFSKCQDSTAVEALRVRYGFPTDRAIRFEQDAKGLRADEFRLYVDMRSEFYTSIYQIMLLCIYRSLKARKYNLGFLYAASSIAIIFCGGTLPIILCT